MSGVTNSALIHSGPLECEADRLAPQPGVDPVYYARGGRFFSPTIEIDAGLHWNHQQSRYEPTDAPAQIPEPFVPWRPKPPRFQAEDERRAEAVRQRVEGRKAGKRYPGDEGYREGDER